MLFRERIKANYTDLSPSFQRLADFLTDHPYEAAFMTATQLGRVLDVDTATVVRFAQRLEYPGFPELLDEIQQEVKDQLVHYFQSPVKQSHKDIFRATLAQDKANIDQFNLTLDTRTIERVVGLINDARKILTVGDGLLSRPLAEMLSAMLRVLGHDCVNLPTDTGTVASEFLSVTDKDLVIAIAVTHYCPDTTSIVELARQRGLATFALVGAQSWAIARAVDLAIVCPNTAPSRGSSLSVFAVAINALSQTLFAQRRKEITGQYMRFEDAMRRLADSRGHFEFMQPEWAVDEPAAPK